MEISEKAARPGPGRPKSQEKRDCISEAAGDLFLAEGFERTSMDAVAARAGVSKQTVYSHFQNKDELFRACIDQKIRKYDLTFSTVPEDVPVREGLMALGERFFNLIMDPSVVAMWRLMIAEAAAHERITALFFEAGPQSTVRNVAAFLERYVRAGDLVIPDIEHAAQVFLWMARGEYHTRLLFNLIGEVPAEERRRHLERAVDEYLAVYGP